MMGNIGKDVIKAFKALLLIALALGIAFGIAMAMSSCLGCTVLHVSYDKHYVGEPPAEERTTDLLERVFDVETTQE